jgi:hypothetical protein
MTRKALVVAAVVAVAGIGAFAAIRHFASPARQLGWTAPGDPGAGAEAGTPAGATEPDASHCGFARFLPPDTEGVAAVYRAREALDALRASEAWRRIRDTEAGREVEAALEEVRRKARDDMESRDPAPAGSATPPKPTFDDLLDLGGEAFSTEVVVALGPGSCEAAAVGWKALAGYVDASVVRQRARRDSWRARMSEEDEEEDDAAADPPGPPPLDAAAADDLLRRLERVRPVPCLFAARVADPAKFDRFFDHVMARLRQEAGTEGDAASSFVADQVVVESRPFRHLRLRVPRGTALDGFVEEAGRDLGLAAPYPGRLAAALTRLEIHAWFGFVGDYFVLSVGPDESLLASCLRIHAAGGRGGWASSSAGTDLREGLRGGPLLAGSVDMARVRGAMDAAWPDVMNLFRAAAEESMGEGELASDVGSFYEGLYDPKEEPWNYSRLSGTLSRSGGLRGESIGRFGSAPAPAPSPYPGGPPDGCLLWVSFQGSDIADAGGLFAGVAQHLRDMKRAIAELDDTGEAESDPPPSAAEPRLERFLRDSFPRHASGGAAFAVCRRGAGGDLPVDVCLAMLTPAPEDLRRELGPVMVDIGTNFAGGGPARHAGGPPDPGFTDSERDGARLLVLGGAHLPPDGQGMHVFQRGDRWGIASAWTPARSLSGTPATTVSPPAAIAWGLQADSYRAAWFDVPGLVAVGRRYCNENVFAPPPAGDDVHAETREIVDSVAEWMGICRGIASSSRREDGLDRHRFQLAIEDLPGSSGPR